MARLFMPMHALFLDAQDHTHVHTHTHSQTSVASGSFLMNSPVAPKITNTEPALRCSLCGSLCVFVCN